MNRLKDRGINATFLYDSCYSGGMGKPLATGEHRQSRAIPRIGVFAPIVRLVIDRLAKAPEPPLNGSTLFVAASRKSQRAYERAFTVPGKRSTVVYGNLSWFLVKRIKAHPELSIAGCLRDVARQFKSQALDQEPIFEASSSERENAPFFLPLP